MKLMVFSVFDSKAGIFGTPFFSGTEASAMRDFSDNVNDSNPRNMWSNHPEDFSLFHIGEFETNTGVIDSIVLKNLVTASALKAVKNIPEIVN